MPRSKQRSEQMRSDSQARIVEAARHLFAEQGYFRVKSADIARAAGMSPGNLYWYFPSKDAVLKAVLAEGFTGLHTLTAEVAARPGSGRAKIEALLEGTSKLYQRQADFARILSALMAHGGTGFLGELGFDMLAIGTGFHQNLHAVFAQARQEGAVADAEPDFLAMLYFALFNGLIITYADLWLSLDPSGVHSAALRLLGAQE